MNAVSQDEHARLVASQKSAFEGEVWTEDDLLSYPERRDRTFDQYSSNCHLIALEPFIKTLTGKTAVTICDGRGSEASYLKAQGLHVTATDLAAHLLPRFKEAGRLDEWSEEDAEKLSFDDDCFDWGLVKAGLHHLPRPMVGFYELFRVSREGIVVMEGQDAPVLRFVRRFAFRARDWESSGNYVYRFTVREIEKACLGLNLPGFAVATRLMPWKRSYRRVRKGSFHYRTLRRFYWLVNLFAAGQGNRLVVVVFKRPANRLEVKLLRTNGFRFRSLPKNPHLS